MSRQCSALRGTSGYGVRTRAVRNHHGALVSAHGRGAADGAGEPGGGDSIGTAEPADFRCVIVDTTVQEGHPLPDRRQADAVGPRTTGQAGQEAWAYARVGKLALIKHQRYAHAKQFKRANRQLKRLRSRRQSAGRFSMIQDISACENRSQPHVTKLQEG